MKLRPVSEVLDAIAAGAAASELESTTLEFKRDPATVPSFRGNPQARLVEEVLDAVVCLSNAEGGRIVLGVDDRLRGPEALIGTDADSGQLRQRIFARTRPALTLSVDEITFRGRRLLVFDVPVGVDLVVDSMGRALRRHGTDCLPMSEDERRALTFERRNPDWTARPSERGIDELDPGALAEVRALLQATLDLRSTMAELATTELLRALNLLTREGALTVAAEILLCQPTFDTVDLLTRPTPGHEPTVRRLRAPLLVALRETRQRVISDLTPEVSHVALPNGQEFALPDFSPLAVDEALTNALVHRDWRLRDRVVIDQSPQILKIRSPGGLPAGVTTDRLLSTPSTPRNPALMAALNQLSLVERASRGIDRMVREQLRVGQTTPRFASDDFYVDVTFTSGAPNRSLATFIAQRNRSVRDSVDALLIVDWLCRHPTVRQDQAAGLFQVAADEAEERLDLLSRAPFDLLDLKRDNRRRRSWSLQPDTSAALGSAVLYRVRADEARPKVQRHLDEYGWITNKTVRNMMDLDVQQARQVLSDLRSAGMIIKDPAGPQRGPGSRWIVAPPES